MLIDTFLSTGTYFYNVKIRTILVLFLLTTSLLFSTQYFLTETFAQNDVANLDNNTITNNSTISEKISDPFVISPSNSNVQNEFNNWNVLSGNWNTSGSGLKGGTNDNTTSPEQNTILNPVLLKNLSKITTTFKINDLDRQLANYVYIIYSFIDPNNYQKAGIHIYKDDIFVRFQTVDNGSVVAEPLHPYIDTGLKWKPGSTINLTLTLHNNDQRLFLNGTQYAGNDEVYVDGLTGLNYGRIKDIDFYSFTNQSMDTANQNSEIKMIKSDGFVVSDSQSLMLEGDSLPSNSFIHLYDSSPYQIMSGHIAAKLPCNEDGVTDVQILMGQIHALELVNLQSVTELSDPDNLCQYHVDVKSTNDNPVTDIVIQNNSTEDIEFPSTSSFIINVNGLSMISY